MSLRVHIDIEPHCVSMDIGSVGGGGRIIIYIASLTVWLYQLTMLLHNVSNLSDVYPPVFELLLHC